MTLPFTLSSLRLRAFALPPLPPPPLPIPFFTSTQKRGRISPSLISERERGCLPFTWGNRLVDRLCKWKAKFLLEISVWGRRVPFEQQTQLTKIA